MDCRLFCGLDTGEKIIALLDQQFIFEKETVA